MPRKMNLELGTLYFVFRILVAVEGVEPASLDYQSSALSLSYTAEEELGSLCFGLWIADTLD